MSDRDSDARPGKAHSRPRGIPSWLTLTSGIVALFALLLGGGLVWHQQTHSVSALMAKLNDKDVKVRGQAVRDLGEHGPEAHAAIPALVERLADESPEVRGSADTALRQIDREWFNRPEAAQAIPSLIERLAGSRLHGVPTEAANAIGRLGPMARDAVPALIRSLKDTTPPVLARTSAAYALGEIGPAAEAAIPALVECLINDPEIRQAASNALGGIGHAAVPSLIECTRHPEAEVRIRALFAFKFMVNPPPPESVIPALEERLTDEDEDVRNVVVEVFKRVGPKAIPALLRQLKTGHDSARELSLYALAGLTPSSTEGTLQVLYERLKQKDRAIDRPAVLAIKLFDPEWATKPTAPLLLPSLIHCLDDDEWLIRIDAMEQLIPFGPAAKDALPALRRQAELEKETFWKEKYQEAIRAIEAPPADKP